MTEIKTTTAWGPKVKRSGLVSVTPMRARPKGTLVPVVVVHGLSEAEVHEAAALLEKSQDVCEWRNVDECTFSQSCQSLVDYECEDVPRLCPSCGRKVVVK